MMRDFLLWLGARDGRCPQRPLTERATTPHRKRSIRNVVYPTVWAVRLQIEIGASGVNLYWPSKLGRLYQLYRSTVLPAWEAIGARIPGDGLAQNYFDKRDGTMRRFYRITEFADP